MSTQSVDNIVGSVIPCNYCSRKFSSTKGLLSHLASNKNLELVCYNCDIVYKNNCAYQYHKMLEDEINLNAKNEQNIDNADNKIKITNNNTNDDNNLSNNAANKPVNGVKNTLQNTTEAKESKRQKVSKVDQNITEEKKVAPILDVCNDEEDKLVSILMDSKSKIKKCPICSKSFGETIDLQLHGRCHGLAFLKYCQKRNLLSASTLVTAKKLL